MEFAAEPNEIAASIALARRCASSRMTTQSTIRLTTPDDPRDACQGFPGRRRLSRIGYAWVATRDPDPGLFAKAAIHASSGAFEIPIE
jgi:hypothetical protein